MNNKMKMINALISQIPNTILVYNSYDRKLYKTGNYTIEITVKSEDDIMGFYSVIEHDEPYIVNGLQVPNFWDVDAGYITTRTDPVALVTRITNILD